MKKNLIQCLQLLVTKLMYSFHYHFDCESSSSKYVRSTRKQIPSKSEKGRDLLVYIGDDNLFPLGMQANKERFSPSNHFQPSFPNLTWVILLRTACRRFINVNPIVFFFRKKQVFKFFFCTSICYVGEWIYHQRLMSRLQHFDRCSEFARLQKIFLGVAYDTGRFLI